jgi:myo-inositol-1(or 4)-monophosphatase
MTPKELEALAEQALEVARDAAALALEGFRKHPEALHKTSAADLVTSFDRAAEARVREQLALRTPGVPVVGEEAGGRASGPTWYCDPIDGTTNFVHGHPFFCTSLGLMDDGVPLLGAVVAPALGLSWHGWVGEPHGSGGRAFRNGEPCRVSSCQSLVDALTATGFNPQSDAAEIERAVRILGQVLPRTRGVRRAGSAALDLTFVADGTLDAYWEGTLHPWDTAAGAALVLAAGGKVSALGGGPAELSRGHILASNGAIHDAMLGLVHSLDPG